MYITLSQTFMYRYMPKNDQEAKGRKTVWKIVNYKGTVHLI